VEIFLRLFGFADHNVLLLAGQQQMEAESLLLDFDMSPGRRPQRVSEFPRSTEAHVPIFGKMICARFLRLESSLTSLSKTIGSQISVLSKCHC
jgi:hypothetical protein